MRSGSERGGILGTLLLTIGIAVALIFLAGWFIAKNMSVHSEQTAHGRSTRFETPLGSAQVSEHSSFSPESVGIPVYPGAVRTDQTGPSFQIEPSGGESFTYSLVEYRTHDSVDQVRRFYRAQSPHWIFTSEPDRPSRAEYTTGGYKRIVILSRHDGETFIGLASTGQAAAN